MIKKDGFTQIIIIIIIFAIIINLKPFTPFSILPGTYTKFRAVNVAILSEGIYFNDEDCLYTYCGSCGEYLRLYTWVSDAVDPICIGDYVMDLPLTVNPDPTIAGNVILHRQSNDYLRVCEIDPNPDNPNRYHSSLFMDTETTILATITGGTTELTCEVLPTTTTTLVEPTTTTIPPTTTTTTTTLEGTTTTTTTTIESTTTTTTTLEGTTTTIESTTTTTTQTSSGGGGGGTITVTQQTTTTTTTTTPETPSPNTYVPYIIFILIIYFLFPKKSKTK